MSKCRTFFCDISRLGKIYLSGTSAFEFVRVMTTVELSRVETPGQAALALVLNAEGEILDLVMVVRSGELEFFLISNSETTDELTEWLQAHAVLIDNQDTSVFEDITVVNSTNKIATMVLYGPEALMILDELSRSDVRAELGDRDLTLITLGELPVMVLRWPLLGISGTDRALAREGEVFEVYLPALALKDFKEILLGFAEIDPEDYEEYVARRRLAHTWFDSAEAAAYSKPTSAYLKALMRPEYDFVGAKALKKLGIHG